MGIQSAAEVGVRISTDHAWGGNYNNREAIGKISDFDGKVDIAVCLDEVASRRDPT